MDPLYSIFAVFGLMAAVVLGLRLFVRRPRGISWEDPPGVRTVAIFSGDAPEFFRDDREDKPYVGVRLFQMLCDGLAARGIVVQNRRNVQNAQGADCVVGETRFGLVLEWLEGDEAKRWVASVDWSPRTGAERRHVALTHQVFAPPDSHELRRLLAALDGWLKDQPTLSRIGWHRKENWLMEDTTDPAPGPISATDPPR